MSAHRAILAAFMAALSSGVSSGAWAAERWQEDVFPAPNAGRLVFAIMSDGNPACASYDATSCLWGQGMAQIDFSRVKPLTCGARHRQLYGVTGFEDPKHWCNLALRERAAQAAPATTPAPKPPASGDRLTGWSDWRRQAGVEYRYRIHWDPATAGPGKTVEAIYEIRNSGGQAWAGTARSADCAQGTLWGSTDVVVRPRETREARVRGPNCGSARNPDIRPNLARQGKFD